MTKSEELLSSSLSLYEKIALTVDEIELIKEELRKVIAYYQVSDKDKAEAYIRIRDKLTVLAFANSGIHSKETDHEQS
jgi:hypothetical protein